MNNGNGLFNFNLPNFNFSGGNMGGANQIQQSLAQGFSPQAMYQSQYGNGIMDMGSLGNIGQAATENPGFLSLESAFGADGSPGWLNGGVSVLNGLGNTWLGMQQYGLAKDSFNFNKGLATQNYENQAQLTNRSLEASLRRNAVAQGNDPEQAVSQGMDKWGLDEEVGG